MTERQIERLARAGFRLLPTPQILTHYVLERDGFVSLVEKRPDGVGGIGAPGMLIDGAFAVLIWRQGAPLFVAKNRETPATPDQVEALRRFDAALREALA